MIPREKKRNRKSRSNATNFWARIITNLICDNSYPEIRDVLSPILSRCYDSRMSENTMEFVETVVNVRYAETDQMGIVYYANYLVWFEVGRVAWCRARGFRYADMEAKDGRFLMVAEASCRYKAPACFEDDIVVRTALAKATDRVIRYRYEIRRKLTGQLLATGETAHVVADKKYRPSRLPDHYRSYFSLTRKQKSE
jgi:acyl-CoA thioester hydrolase